jgi:RND family efflux transporter MFP subunit
VLNLHRDLEGSIATRSRVVLVGLGLCVAALGCSEPEPEPEILRPVRAETVVLSGASRVRKFSGTAKAGKETQLSFRVSGTIQRLNVKVGDTVVRGALIASLDPKDFEIAVEQSRANLARAEATARNAASNLERIRGLWENDNAAQNDLDAAQANDESASAQVEASRKALEGAQRQLSFTRLKAPVEGAIASVAVEVNENVRQGQTVVLLTSGSRPEVEIAMPELLIAQIREGDPVSVTFDALPGDVFDAAVSEVGVAATGTATTFPVTVRLNRPGGAIRSGMAANVSFRFESNGAKETIYLPTYAVGGDRGGRFVFLLETTEEPGIGTVRRTAVEVGELTPDGLEVLSGVSEGQQVVTAGVRRLTDGQRVKLLASGESR